MTIPVRYISRHKSDGRPVLEGFVVAKIWSREADRLQAVLAARHGCNVSKRVLACPIDKINDFPRQFGWQQYQNFMMGQMGYSPSALTEMLQAQQTPIPVAQAVFTRNDQQPPVDVVPNQANANVAVAEQIPAEPNGAAAVPGGGRDVLDIIYKVFRVVLLLSAVMLYSSLERFLAVLTIALFIFFIQLRRNYQRQARMADPPEPNVNNNNAGEQPQEATEQAPAYVAPTPPSGIQVFFATCYSFITSFFTSLIPDHPVPVDLN